MTILPIQTGRFNGRSYLCVSGSEAAAVDPDGNAAEILRLLEEHGASLRWILLTHCHFDHTGAAADLQAATGAVLAAHRLDAPCLCDGAVNMSAHFGQPPVTGIKAERELEEGDAVPLGAEALIVLHTPGHTAGSVCYRAGDDLLTGDTLFRGAVGTTQCTGGSAFALRESVLRLYALGDDIVIWPGHGQRSTIGRERRLGVIE